MTFEADDTPSSGETDRKKIYAGKLAVRSIYGELFRLGKGSKDWLKLIPQVCLQVSESKAMIDQIMIHGPPTGTDERMMIARCLVQLTAKVNAMDNLTKVGMMAYQDSQFEPYRWFSDDFYLAPFNVKYGVCCGCSGLLRSGKTNWAFVLMEMGLANGWEIVTNMKIDVEGSRDKVPGVDKVHYVQFFTDMIKVLSGPGKKLLVMDEISQYFERKTAMAKENIELEHFLRLMGKMKTQAIFIEQDEDRYPTLFEKFMQVMYFKPSIKQLEYTVWMPELKIHRYLSGIPLTVFDWDTYHPASFYVDVDLMKFNELLVVREDFKMGDLPEMLDDFKTSRPGDSKLSNSMEPPPLDTDTVKTTVNTISQMSKGEQDALRGERGGFDWNLIKFDFKISSKAARTVSNVLNRDARMQQVDSE